ncbi:MAG: cupin domain-containing protein [Hyphomicrobium sp.]|nr:cupin domain-containing protein [Hyphomicrobium sp.]
MRCFQFAVTLALAAVLATLPVSAQADPADAEIVTIRPAATTGTKQGLPIFQGISGQNAGAKHISMNKVIIPPGGAAKAHIHKGYESVIYLIKGKVKTLYGEGLNKSIINETGDFIYIPADLPHKPINLSATEPAEAIVARTDPNEQESVEHVAEPGAADAKE